MMPHDKRAGMTRFTKSWYPRESTKQRSLLPTTVSDLTCKVDLSKPKQMVRFASACKDGCIESCELPPLVVESLAARVPHFKRRRK